MWDVILSCLVIFHLVTEYVHYVYEYLSGNREKNILIDIQRHRMRSHKTAMLERMQKDLDLIKEELGIGAVKKKCELCGEDWKPRHFWSCKGKEKKNG